MTRGPSHNPSSAAASNSLGIQDEYSFLENTSSRLLAPATDGDPTVEEYALEEEDKEAEVEASDVQQLAQWWRNERTCPNVLPFQFELIMNLLELINAQAEALKEEEGAGDFFHFQYQSMELDRVKFLVKSYLATRLLKLQKYARHLVRSQAETWRELVAKPEMQFVQNMATLEERHYLGSALAGLDPALSSLEDPDTILKPNMSFPVFIRPRVDIGDWMLEEDKVVELRKESTYFLQYRFVERLLLEGPQIDLI